MLIPQNNGKNKRSLTPATRTMSPGDYYKNSSPLNLSITSTTSFNMKVLIFLTLAGLAACVDYEHVLQSPTELKNLFVEFNTKFGKTFSPAEGPMRMRLFRNDLKEIVRLNKEHEWVSGKYKFLKI